MLLMMLERGTWRRMLDTLRMRGRLLLELHLVLLRRMGTRLRDDELGLLRGLEVVLRLLVIRRRGLGMLEEYVNNKRHPYQQKKETPLARREMRHGNNTRWKLRLTFCCIM